MVKPILAFCHLRKTGGVTFNYILRRQYGGAHLDAIVRFVPCSRINQQFYTAADLEKDRWIYPQIRSIAGHYLCPAIDYGALGRAFRWLVILRDPVRRYVSHYGHYVEKKEGADDFQKWMTHEKHHNDQVKTIAGEENLDKAKQLLEQHVLVGFQECYDLSLCAFQKLLPEFELDVHYPRLTNRAKGVVDAERLIERHVDQIKENNRLDQQLYDFARDVIWPKQIAGLDLAALESDAQEISGVDSSMSRLFRLAWARGKRQFAYKPFVRMVQPRG
jgi:hypothetical protein